jgi:hypothetical protein
MNMSLAFVVAIGLLGEAVIVIGGTAPGAEGGLQALLIFAGIWALYWVPVFVAVARHRVSVAPITIINFFFGWTLIGWVVALAMAAGGATRRAEQTG